MLTTPLGASRLYSEREDALFALRQRLFPEIELQPSIAMYIVSSIAQSQQDFLERATYLSQLVKKDCLQLSEHRH